MRSPLVPDVTDIIPTARSVNISFTIRSIVYDAETYRLYYIAVFISSNSTERLGPANVSDMYTVTISGLIPYTRYYFFVSAENSEGTTNTSSLNFITDETGMAMAIETVYNKIVLLFVVHA